MTMNVPRYHQENPQPMAPHPAGYAQDLPTQDGPSTWELKADPDVRPEQEEACPVCGDRVSGYHYGLLTCESCKGFFKRSVQNNKRYTCAERQSCPMDPAQRKRCPYCRFQKCLAVGMKREAVRADRMRGGRNKFGPLYRRDRQLKQQRGGFHQASTAHYRIKLEGPQAPLPALSHDFHLLPGPFPAALGPDPFHQSQPISPTVSQPELPVVLDCTMARERALTAAGLPYGGLYHPGFHGYPHEKREMAYSYSSASVTPLTPGAIHSVPTPVLTPPSTHTPTSTPTLTPDPPASSTSFLSELLQGEPEESQVSARVVASLRREQASRGKHDRLNTFSIMCKMADQTLFGLVEWARNCTLFKELKVEDQMVLLQSCWSELLVLDHLCRQVAYGRDGSIYLVTGQQIEVSTVLSQAGPTLSSLVSRAQDLVSKLRALQLDRQEFVCLKYLVLFNPDVKSVQDRQQVERTQERVNRALMEHTLQTHPGHSDKFGQLLLRLPEVRSISLQVEEYLYQRHLLGDLPCNSLLTEMLHAKHT
ncbi:nuclear receptor subfamily 5, group A, member 5 isoform X2 [Colossoma macropomum]|uniref:nuclear receptor subfamily 5, group A, member 5 isoform X2 n=1 Tax=Colossoma macropomum TaxID=42526 RepID=UPI0018643F1D|nr:nuclear receptor subfamily 5, group A, member 5 isoform X2 [Colossoma macropomum]